MTTLLLLAAVLTGQPPDAKPTLRLIVHIDAKSREGRIVESELSREHLWFASRRYFIGQNYRIEVRDDVFKSRACYQIGTADERHEFPQGTFSASGSFIRTLESIADIDQWERHEPDRHTYYGYPEWLIEGAARPIPFPPQPAIETANQPKE